jgi:hypothetical protein
MMKKILALMSLGLFIGLLSAADFPKAEITNGQLRVTIHLPDAKNGYYRGTRFDWSGVIYSLKYKGHEYYGPWFQKTDPKIRDFVYEGPDIIASPCSAVTGPVDEFGPLGWNEAQLGGNFIKIGVGALRKPDEVRYNQFRLYEIASQGKWTIKKNRNSVEFNQELTDSASGYGYIYRKTVRLTKGRPEMALEHSLKNVGTLAIKTSVYNHNFLVMDGQPPGPGLVITVPFQLKSRRPISTDLAEIRGNQIVYLKTLVDRDSVRAGMQGFSASPKDHEVRIENSKLGMGMRFNTDRPLTNEALWSIRAVVGVEPFIALAIEPGNEFTWKTTYNYYTLPVGK